MKDLVKITQEEIRENLSLVRQQVYSFNDFLKNKYGIEPADFKETFGIVVIIEAIDKVEKEAKEIVKKYKTSQENS